MRRPKIKRADKAALVQEAGHKCANPGCPKLLTEIHHIRRWHVVKTHDVAHMIAICPSCHDAVERGSLRIDDAVAYSWKKIYRGDLEQRGTLYVESSVQQRAGIVLDRCIVTSETLEGVLAFEIVHGRRLAFHVNGLEMMKVNINMFEAEGKPLFSMIDNDFKCDGPAALLQRAGMIRVTHPRDELVLPGWVVDQVRVVEEDFQSYSDLVVLELEVLKPNVVSVRGCWVGPGWAAVVTAEGVYFCRQDRQILSIRASGPGYLTPIECRGGIERPILQMEVPGVQNLPGILNFIPNSQHSFSRHDPGQRLQNEHLVRFKI